MRHNASFISVAWLALHQRLQRLPRPEKDFISGLAPTQVFYGPWGGRVLLGVGGLLIAWGFTERVVL